MIICECVSCERTYRIRDEGSDRPGVQEFCPRCLRQELEVTAYMMEDGDAAYDVLDSDLQYHGRGYTG